MKRILILAGVIVCIIAAHVTFAQTQEGVITYEVTINLHRNLPPGREEMKERIPEYRTHREQLFFNTAESLYKPVIEEEEDVEDFGSGGPGRGRGAMRMRFRPPGREVYCSREQSQQIIQQEFMGKKYLIEDALAISPWKFGTETRTILGYTCKQASYYDEGRKQQVVAWYTDKFRPFLGPETYNTLPGAVLAVDLGEGERVMTATGIEPRALKRNELKAPSGGTKTTHEEFRKIMEAQRERMRVNGGNMGWRSRE